MPLKTHHRKKVSRQHGSRSHGWGHKKKHRGKGSKGGAGRAGRGKHGGSRRTLIENPKEYYGKHGFTSIKTPDRIITTRDLNEKLPGWVKTEEATHSGKMFSIDLGKLKYTKLVAKGILKLPVTVTVKAASKRAVEKIQKAGGKVVGLESTEEKD